jgi:hypothetical protein
MTTTSESLSKYSLIEEESEEDVKYQSIESYESDNYQHCIVCEASHCIFEYDFVWVAHTKIICNVCFKMIKNM